MKRISPATESSLSFATAEAATGAEFVYGNGLLLVLPNFTALKFMYPTYPPGTSKWKALRSFEWVSAWLSGIVPSGAPPPTPRRSPPRGSGERRALTPLLSPNHRLLALNHLVNLLSRHMLGLTACATPRQLDDSIPRENYPHESAKGQME